MVIRGDVKLNSSPTSGTGDPILTRDATSGVVGEVGAIDVSVYIPTTLTSGYILVGNASNVATGVAMSGDVTISNTGVSAISSGVIVNADVNASAAIALNKLATVTASRALASDASGYITVSSVTSTELGYVSGVTSAIQTQLDSKQATITGGATTIVSSNLTVSRLLVSDGSGKVAVSSVTSTEAGYISGVTSSVQTQLNAKQAAVQYKDEGSNLGTNGSVTVVDFTGSGVTASHSGGTVTVNIPGTANGLPAGGTAGQVLIKDSGTDYDATFQDLTLAEVTDVTASAVEVNILDGATLTTTELNYVDGVTSNIQTQLDTKLNDNLAQNAMWYGNAANQATQLAPGTDGYVLVSSGGVPTWSPNAGGGHTIQDEGTPLTQRTNLNFVGSAVTVTDDSGGDATVVTISGGSITGTDTQVLFFDGTDNPAGDAGMTYNKTSNVLTADGFIVNAETASRVAIIDASKNIKSADTATYPSLTELSYVKGVTSAIQNQIDGKASLDQAAYWKTLPGTPTRSSNTVLTITDTSNANLYDLKFSRGTVFKWTDTGDSVVRMAMVKSATYSSNTVTITIVGDVLNSTATMNTFKYAAEKALSLKMAYAGTLSIQDDLTNQVWAQMKLKLFGAIAHHGVAGTTNATTYSISKNSLSGANFILSSDLSVSSGAVTSDLNTVTDKLTMDIDDYLVTNCETVSTTAPRHGYVEVFYLPFNNIYL